MHMRLGIIKFRFEKTKPDALQMSKRSLGRFRGNLDPPFVLRKLSRSCIMRRYNTQGCMVVTNTATAYI